MEPPLFPTSGLQIVRAAPGSAATLVLPLPFGSPPFQYKWSRAGASLDERFIASDDAGGVRLTVSAARTGDSGVYTLQASNAAGKDTARVRLEVSPDEAPEGDDPPNFLRRLQDLTVKVGTRTRFLVEIVSSTECKVTWYRNERRLMETERVALVRDGNFWCADVGAVSVDDAGRWTCTAENGGGRASCSAHLNVLVPKAYKRPEFVEELRALLTEQGTVSLECKVVGVPTPVLRWFKDSREIKAGDVFALTANAEDPTSLGTYTCEAVNCMGRAYSSSKVHVVGRASREGSARPSSGGLTPDPPPIFTKELEDQFVRICDPLTLNCHIVVPPWPRSVVWYNKEGKIEPSERYHVLEDGVGGYLLEVSAAEWADEGEWKCVASTAGGRVGMSTCYVSMDVPKNYRKPRFMENLQAVLTEEGLVSFECKVVGFPTPVLSWFKDGQELKPGDVYQLTGTNSLGSYCCIARNCMGQASSSAELTVEDIQNQLNEEEKHQLFSKNQAPKFLQGLKSVEAKIDEPFRFTIKVAIPPEPSLLWYRDDQPVDESSRCHHGKEERGVFYLDIQNLEFLDQAEWKCVAINDFGQSVTSCFLKLIIPRHYKKPRFLENLQAILSDEGAVNLECKVIGVPQPVLKWYKDGEELKPGDIHRIISGQDGTCCLGTYTCEAQNCMGIAASSASLLGFDDSLKVKSKKKSEEQNLQRNLSLSTIHEERTSQMYDTPLGDRTLDDKGEISFSFDGKEVSVSLYETPDLTEEEALQIVEMYADQLSENVTEHNVVELPPLRFVKETSTSGNLLMEAIIIDVSPEYFTSPEEDLRTEADIEDISIADENGPPQISLDQDQDVSGQDYLEKTMALLSDERADMPKKIRRKKSDSQKSGDDYYSLSREQSLSDDKKDDDTQVFSESDLQSFASARSSEKLKLKTSRHSVEETALNFAQSTDITKTTQLKEEVATLVDISKPKHKRERRSSKSSRRSSSGSEKSSGRSKDEINHFDIPQPSKKLIADEEYKTIVNNITNCLSKLMNNIQIIERDIILQSELMSSSATASKSLEIIGSLITPVSEIYSIIEAAKDTAYTSSEINSALFNNFPQPLKALYQSLTIIEKCIDVESDNKTLVKKTCVSLIEKCGNEIHNIVNEISSLLSRKYLDVDDKLISEIELLSNEIITTVRFSNDTVKARSLLHEASEFKLKEPSLEVQHSKDTQKAIFELKTPLQSLLRIVESAERDNLIDGSNIKNSEIILNDMSASIKDLQEALEQIESLSVKESSSSLMTYNTEIIETVMDSVLKLRNSFEQLSIEAKKEENENILKQVLSTVKSNLNEISSHINLFENKIGKFDILQSENKLEVLQKMAQTLIQFENSLPALDVVSSLKCSMLTFHKNLTKVLENVIESNDATKYFAFMEICDSINRVNSSVKNIESNEIFSLTSISNALKIVQDQVTRNVFESELNNSLLNNIQDIQMNLLENINLAEEISFKTESDHIQALPPASQEKSKAYLVIENIEHSIAAITNVLTEECANDLKTVLIPIFENIQPTLVELKQKIASMTFINVQENDHTSEISEKIFSQHLADPILELNQNILILNQTLVENVKSLKENSALSATYAQPLQELQTTLEILQQDVISQCSDDVLQYDVAANIANVVQNLQNCILLIQEQSGIETADEMSTLEDVSGIKTTAEIIPTDQLLVPTTVEVNPEHLTETLNQTQPDVATATTLQSLHNHVLLMQQPDIIEFLDSLSEISDYTNLNSVAIHLSELNEGVKEIFHPILENTNDFVSSLNTSKLLEIAEPIQDLQQSLSVIDTNNIPIYESCLKMPSEKIHSAIEEITVFKNHLEKCVSIIMPAMETADEMIEISNNVDLLKKMCCDIHIILQDSAEIPIYNNPEVSNFREKLNDFIEATNSQNIDITAVKSLTEVLYEALLKVQDELIQCTPQSCDTMIREIQLVQSIQELENKFAVLEQFHFVDLSRASDIESISPQYAIEIQTDSLVQIEDLVNHLANIVQDEISNTQAADLMIIEDFFKNCKQEFSLLHCLITKRPTHKKIIRLLQEFRFIRSFINDFKQKRSGMSLPQDINELLSNFIISLDTPMKDIENSLIKIVNSQSKLLIETPLTNLDSSMQILKEEIKSDKTMVDLFTKFIDLVEYIRPHFKNVKAALLEELQSSAICCQSSLEESVLNENLDAFFTFLNEQMSNDMDAEKKQLTESLLTCLKKHKNYRDIAGQSKMLLILKCLTECSNILKDVSIDDDIRKVKTQYLVLEAEETCLRSILQEMMEPLLGLHSKLKSIQEQISSGVEEESISIDISSTESYIQALTDIHKDVTVLLESETTIVDDANLSLIEDLDNEIHTIQQDVQSLGNIEGVDIVKQIIFPLEQIEKSFDLAKEKGGMDTKNVISKDINSNISSLTYFLKRYIQIETDLLDTSKFFPDIDVNECLALATEIYHITKLNPEENSENTINEYNKLTERFTMILKKFDWLNSDLLNEISDDIVIQKLNRVFLASYQLLNELCSELYNFNICDTNVPEEKADALLQHIDQYIEFVEIVEEDSAVIKIDEIMETTNIARELRESMNEIDIGSDFNYRVSTEQDILINKFNNALSVLQVNALDNVLEMPTMLDDDKRQQLAAVVTLLQEDLKAITSMQLPIVAPADDTEQLMPGIEMEKSVIDSDIKVDEGVVSESQQDIKKASLITSKVSADEFVDSKLDAKLQQTESVANEALTGIVAEGEISLQTMKQFSKENTENLATLESTNQITPSLDQAIMPVAETSEVRAGSLNADNNAPVLYIIEKTDTAIDTATQTTTIGSLVHHIEEYLSGDVVHIIEKIASVTKFKELEQSVNIAKELYESIAALEVSPSASITLLRSEESVIRKEVVSQLQEVLKVFDVITNLHAEELQASVDKKSLECVTELVQNLHAAIATIASPILVEKQILNQTVRDDNLIMQESDQLDIQQDQPENIDSMKKLESLLSEVSNYVMSTDATPQDTECLRNVLDEVQSVIIKLKCDFDEIVNDTLNETLEDLECSVRSVQLQLDENIAPELLKDACDTLQLLVTNMKDIQNNVSSPVKEKMTLQKCYDEIEQTITLLDDASTVDVDDQMKNVLSKLNILKDSLKSLSLHFHNDANILIDNGIEVIQCLNQMEEQIFSLEKDIESTTYKTDIRDNLILAVHTVYENISNMRSTLFSIQKVYMYENYAKPSENFLRSLKNVAFLSKCDKTAYNWKHLAKVLRQVLNHFEDIKFYVNFDKTARIPSDAAFTKILIEELTNELNNVLTTIQDLYPEITDEVVELYGKVKENNVSLESLATLEVKHKIPIFKILSEQILKLTNIIRVNAENIKNTQGLEMKHGLSEILTHNISESKNIYDSAHELSKSKVSENETLPTTLIGETEAKVRVHEVETKSEITNSDEELSEIGSNIKPQMVTTSQEQKVLKVEGVDIEKQDYVETNLSELRDKERNDHIIEQMPSCSTEKHKESEVDEKLIQQKDTDVTIKKHKEQDADVKEMLQDKQEAVDGKYEEGEEKYEQGNDEEIFLRKQEDSTDFKIKADDQESFAERVHEEARLQEEKVKIEAKHSEIEMQLTEKEDQGKEKNISEHEARFQVEKGEIEEEFREIEKQTLENKNQIEKELDSAEGAIIQKVKDEALTLAKKDECPRVDQDEEDVTKHLIKEEMKTQKEKDSIEAHVKTEENQLELTGIGKEIQDDKKPHSMEADVECKYKEKDKADAQVHKEGHTEKQERVEEKVKLKIEEAEYAKVEEEKQLWLKTEDEEQKCVEEEVRAQKDATDEKMQEDRIRLEKEIHEEDEKFSEVAKLQKDKDKEGEKLKDDDMQPNKEIKHEEEGLWLEKEKQEEERKGTDVDERLQEEKAAMALKEEEERMRLEREKEEKDERRSEDEVRLQKEKDETDEKLKDEEGRLRLEKEKQEEERKRVEDEKLQKDKAAMAIKEEEERMRLEKEKEEKDKKRTEDEARLQKEKDEADAKLKEEDERLRLEEEKQEEERKRGEDERLQKDEAAMALKEEEERTRLEKEKEEKDKKRTDDEARLQNEKEEADAKLKEEDERFRLEKEKQEEERKNAEENKTLQKEKAAMALTEEELTRLERENEEKRTEDQSTLQEEKIGTDAKHKEEDERLRQLKEKQEQEGRRAEEDERSQKEEAAMALEEEEERTRLEKEKEEKVKCTEDEERLQKEKDEADAKLKEKDERLRLEKQKQEEERKQAEKDERLQDEKAAMALKEEERTRLERENDEEKPTEDQSTLQEEKIEADAKHKEEDERLRQVKEKQEEERKRAEKDERLQEEKAAMALKEEEERTRLEKENEEKDKKLTEDEARLQKQKDEADAKLKEEDERLRLEKEKQEEERKRAEDERLPKDKAAMALKEEEERTRLEKEKDENDKKRTKKEGKLQKEKDEADAKLKEEDERLRLEKEKQEEERKRAEDEGLQKDKAAMALKEEEERTRLEKEKEEIDKKRTEDEARLQKEEDEADAKLKEEDERLRLEKEKQEDERKRAEDERLQKDKAAITLKEEEERTRLKKEKEEIDKKRTEDARLQKEKDEADAKLKEEDERLRLEKQKQEEERKRAEKDERLQEKKAAMALKEEEERTRLEKEKEERDKKRTEDEARLQKEKDEADAKLKEEDERLRLEKQKQEEERKRAEDERLQKDKVAMALKEEEERMRLEKEKEEKDKKRAEDEARLQKQKDEADAKLKEEDELLLLEKEKQEEERKRAEDERLKKDKAAMVLKEEEERMRLEKEKEEKDKKRTEDEARLQKEKEADAKLKEEDELLLLEKEKQEEERKRAEDERLKKDKAAMVLKEEVERMRLEKEKEENDKKRTEDEARLQKEKDEANAKLKEEDERLRLEKEKQEEERKRAEDERLQKDKVAMALKEEEERTRLEKEKEEKDKKRTKKEGKLQKEKDEADAKLKEEDERLRLEKEKQEEERKRAEDERLQKDKAAMALKEEEEQTRLEKEKEERDKKRTEDEARLQKQKEETDAKLKEEDELLRLEKEKQEEKRKTAEDERLQKDKAAMALKEEEERMRLEKEKEEKDKKRTEDEARLQKEKDEADAKLKEEDERLRLEKQKQEEERKRAEDERLQKDKVAMALKEEEERMRLEKEKEEKDKKRAEDEARLQKQKDEADAKLKEEDELLLLEKEKQEEERKRAEDERLKKDKAAMVLKEEEERMRLEKEKEEKDKKRTEDEARLQKEKDETDAKLKEEDERLRLEKEKQEEERKRAEDERLQKDKVAMALKEEEERTRLEKEKEEKDKKRTEDEAKLQKEKDEADAKLKEEDERLRLEKEKQEEERKRAEDERLQKDKVAMALKEEEERTRLEKEKEEKDKKRTEDEAKLQKEKDEADAKLKEEDERLRLEKEKQEEERKRAEDERLQKDKVAMALKEEEERTRLEKEKEEKDKKRTEDEARLQIGKDEADAKLKEEDERLQLEKQEQEKERKRAEKDERLQEKKAAMALKEEDERTTLEKEKEEKDKKRTEVDARLEKEKVEADAKLKQEDEQLRLEKEKQEEERKRAEDERLQKDKAAMAFKEEEERTRLEKEEKDKKRTEDEARLQKDKDEADAKLKQEDERLRLEKEKQEEERKRAEDERLQKDKVAMALKEEEERTRLEKEKEEKDKKRTEEEAKLQKEKDEADAKLKEEDERLRLEKEKQEEERKRAEEYERLQKDKAAITLKEEEERMRREKEKEEKDKKRIQDEARLQKEKTEADVKLKEEDERLRLEKEKQEEERKRAEDERLQKDKAAMALKEEEERTRLEKEKDENDKKRTKNEGKLQKEKDEADAKLKEEDQLLRLEKEKQDEERKRAEEDERLQKDKAAMALKEEEERMRLEKEKDKQKKDKKRSKDEKRLQKEKDLADAKLKGEEERMRVEKEKQEKDKKLAEDEARLQKEKEATKLKEGEMQKLKEARKEEEKRVEAEAGLTKERDATDAQVKDEEKLLRLDKEKEQEKKRTDEKMRLQKEKADAELKLEEEQRRVERIKREEENKGIKEDEKSQKENDDVDIKRKERDERRRLRKEKQAVAKLKGDERLRMGQENKEEIKCLEEKAILLKENEARNDKHKKHEERLRMEKEKQEDIEREGKDDIENTNIFQNIQDIPISQKNSTKLNGSIDKYKVGEIDVTALYERTSECKEKAHFINYNNNNIGLETYRPPGYIEKKYDDINRYPTVDTFNTSKIPATYKAQTLVYQAQLRSSSPQHYEIRRSSESTERRLDTRQRSKALSEARSIMEKRAGTSRDHKRKPVFSTYLTDRTAVESSRVKLTCSVLSSIDPKITWFKNGVLLDDKLKYKTKFVDGLITLEVLNAVPSDSAEYTCTVQNENGSVSTSAVLKVYPSFEASPIPPTFTRSIRDTYHLAENELILECRIRGQPLPTITWLKDDRPIGAEERYQAYYLADGVCRLAISAPTKEDSGKYTCKAENSMWSDQITHVVNFTGKESPLGPNLATIERSRFNRQIMESRRPHFTNVLSDYKVTRGGTIGLQVEIKGSPTRVEWLREGRSVTEVYRNAQTIVEHGLYTLALTDVTEKESGLYTCRAWSSHGNVDMNAAITVVQPNDLEGKPAIIVGRPQKDVLISVGEDLNISFRVQGEPRPKVIFMKGIRDITNSQRVCKMTSDDYVKFTLKRSVVSDAGTYCILARNAYGCDRAFVTVVIRQRASSENLISDWTYPQDDASVLISERKYKSVPDRIPGEPSAVDGGNNWISLAWPKPDHRESAPVLAYKVESWLLGKEGGARWVELGITPLNSFDAFNLKQGEEYHFRVTPRNRYGWGEPRQTSNPIGIGQAGDRPEFTEILPGQLKVLVGETARLSCSFKGKPVPEIVWMKNGHEIDDDDDRIQSLLNGFDCCLTIRNVQIEDEARYSCEASNLYGRASTYARMAVITDRLVWEADAKLKRERSAGVEGEYPPQFTMRLRDRRVQATYPVRLTCQVIGNPDPLVTWFKDGMELFYDSRHSRSQDEHFHTLEIAPTSLEDGGVYEAMARNSRGAVSCRCSLVVDKGIRAYVAPEFCCGLEPLYKLHEGEELRISAMVEAYPSVGVTWYRDGVRLRPSRRAVMTLDHDGQIELALANVTARDAGVYTCTASNEVGRASTSGKVEVLGGGQVEEKTRTPPLVIRPDVPYSKEPMFIRKPRSSEAREGDTVIIECEVIGDPKPDVYWLRDFLKPDYYRDANHFKRVGGGPEYRFEIPHAKLDYTGTYSVVARNCHAEAKAIISLQILAKDISASDDAHNIKYGRVDVIPRFDKELTDLLCYDGDAIEFECRVSGSPEPYIKWLHYSEIIRESDDFETTYEEGTARLKIKQVTAEDEGTYTCEASNSLGKAKSSACLVVYPPGEPNTLSQRLRRPPALLSAASTPRSTPRATPARSLSRTPGPDARRLCSPSREVAPKFYTYPFNKVVEEGESVVFKCAVKGLPNPWTTWDKDGIVITPTSRITIREKDEIHRILEIEEVTVEDVGLYRITLENDYGRAEASARLEVISHKGKFYGGIRSCSASPRRNLYRRRTPSTSRQD